MIANPTCPKCGVRVTDVDATALDAHIAGKRLLSVAFSCRACGVVLGVTVDPLAIKADTVTDIVTAIREGKA